VSVVKVFGRTRLQNGDTRTVAVLSRRNDSPCLALACWRGREIVARLFVHLPRIPAVLRAVELARDPSFSGFQTTSEQPPSARGTSIRIAARAREERSVMVALFCGDVRVSGTAHFHLGGELDDLESAARHALRIARDHSTERTLAS
jgi:hypothetical protein